MADGLPDDTSILFVHQGDVEHGCRFFDRLWPEARAVSDPERALYRGVDLRRGSLRELFGPAVWRRGLAAVVKGHFVGAPSGDPRIMPGMWLVTARGDVVWRHAFEHAGDHPSADDVAAAVAATRRAARADA